jgi:hypothetical protein
VTNESGRPREKGNAVSAPPVARTHFAESMEALRQYDPDGEAKPKLVSIQEAYDRLKIPMASGGRPTSLSGRFVLPKDSRGVIREAFGWEQVNRLRESAEWKVKQLRETHGMRPRAAARALREADGFGLGEPTDPVSGGAPNDEFRPLLLGPFQRQLYLYDMLDMQAKAFELFHHHPIAKSAINLLVYFTLGDGMRVRFRSPALQDAWDQWTERVRWQEKWRLAYRDACIVGETFVLDEGSARMHPTMRMLDASTVWEIVTNPRDIDEVFYLHRQFPTQYQLPYGPLEGGSIPVPVSEYVIEQFAAQEWLQVKLNATVGEKRGRSDLFSVLGWMKRFRDWFNAAVVRGQIGASFVVWWELNGSQADVDAFKSNTDVNRLPPAGSAWYSNQAAVPHLLTPEGGVSASDRTGEAILAVIATSLNLPPEYLGVSGAAARATALKRGEPAGKIFEQRQQMMREAVSWQVRRFIASELASGRVDPVEIVPARASQAVSAIRRGDLETAETVLQALRDDERFSRPIDEGFEVTMPQIEPQDRSTMLRDLATARATGVYSQETYARRAAELLDDKTYDYDAEREMIAEELESGIVPIPVPQSSMADEGRPKPGSHEDIRRYEDQTNGRRERG